MIGQTISHYRIIEMLGGGGMGVVCLWKDADPDIPILTKAKAEYARLR